VSDDVYGGDDDDNVLHAYHASQVSISSEQKTQTDAVCLVYRQTGVIVTSTSLQNCLEALSHVDMSQYNICVASYKKNIFSGLTITLLYRHDIARYAIPG
jgi:hypothetical protein